ncbi:MAG: O-antigen/teichoic acid export membrane protein [Saprospiraceae bacterium]|jgi:O-antigen/teichoic acid export membrane protein
MGIVKKQGVQNTIISYVGSIIGFLNKIVLFPKVFLIAQVGLLNVLLSVSVLYAQVSGFGIFNVIIKFYPEYKKEGKSTFLKLILKWLVVGFLFLSSLFLFFEDYIKDHLFDKAPLLQEYFYWIFPLSFLILFFEALNSYSRAILKSVFPSFLKDFVLRLLMFFGIILFYFDLILFDQFLFYFAGTYAFINVALIVYLFVRGEFIFTKSAIQKISYKQIFKFGVFVFFAESSALLVSTIDGLMLADYRGLNDAGVYTTMVFLTSAFLIPYGAISKIVTPIIPRLWKENNLKELQKIYVQVSNTSFALSAFLFLLILFNLELLLNFLPEVYSTGAIVFLGIGLSRLIDVFYGINGVIIVNSKKYMIDLVFVSFLIALTIGTNYFFIPLWGMKGAVFASLISILTINLIRGAYLRMTFNLKLFNIKSVLQITFFLLTLFLSFWNPFDSLWLTIVFRNIVGIVLFIFPYYYFNLAPEIKDWVLKRLAR